MATLLKWKSWLYGLGSAFIGGGAGSIVSAPILNALDPGKDLGMLKLFGILFLTHGVVSVAMYLKQSPLPPPDEVSVAAKP